MCGLVFGARYVIALFIDELFLCQTYVGIISELFLFETEKYSSLEFCRASFIFLCGRIRQPCNCITLLILDILS